MHGTTSCDHRELDGHACDGILEAVLDAHREGVRKGRESRGRHPVTGDNDDLCGQAGNGGGCEIHPLPDAKTEETPNGLRLAGERAEGPGGRGPPLHVRLRLGGGRAPTALYDLERNRHTDGGISQPIEGVNHQRLWKELAGGPKLAVPGHLLQHAGQLR